MHNRISQHIKAQEIATIFSTVPSRIPLDMESLFEGPKTLENLVQEELERVRKAGYRKAVEKITGGIKKQIEKFIYEAIKTHELIQKASAKFIPALTITQCRTNFNFTSPAINLFFVVDSTSEEEIAFSNLLNKVEQIVLGEDNFIIETYFINSSGKEIDFTSLKNEYPFIIPPIKE